MRLRAYFCDLCIHDDGKLVLAAATYWGGKDRDVIYHVCDRHWQEVKRTGWRNLELEYRGGIDTARLM